MISGSCEFSLGKQIDGKEFMAQKESKITLIPLGGLGEIGNNMTVVRYGNSMIVIDCGMEFPEDDMLGIDTVIPDYTFLVENKKRIKGIFLTHGHEDHIGALPYVLKELDVPVYGTRLTLGLVSHKLKEAHVTADLHEMSPGDVLPVSPFKVEFIRVNHSIPDAVGMAIHTPIGVIFHTGDFKIDLTPVDGAVMDLHRIAALGSKGILLMMADSTNAERPGFTKSEKLVGNSFNDNFRAAKGRIIVATFATNVHRLQQVISTAAKYNRKVAIVGRSMMNVVSIATDLGYLKVPKHTMIDIDEIDSLPPNKVTILATGSQGEPMSTLTRIANGEHRHIKLMPGDTIIVSALPIPGNEVSSGRNIDLLVKQGAEVVADADSDIHVSGHARQEELKFILALAKPKYFVPVHGEERMLYKHASIAQKLGIPSDNIFVLDNGTMLEITKKSALKKGSVATGKIMIDGMGDKDVGSVVLHDRRQLANDGIMVVIVTVDRNGVLAAKPEMISRGFIYVKESEDLMETARENICKLMEKYEGKRIKDFSTVKQKLKESVGKTLYADVKRKPMIIPIIIELD